MYTCGGFILIFGKKIKKLKKKKLKEHKPDLWLTRVKSREKVFRISSRKNV